MVKKLAKQYGSLMWGGGIILSVLGIGLLLIKSLLIGLPITDFYPYLNENFLLALQIIAWVNLIAGILVFILGFWTKYLVFDELDPALREKISTKTKIKYVRISVIMISILLILAFPIGTFIGLTLIRESWMIKHDQARDSDVPPVGKEKIQIKNSVVEFIESNKFKGILSDNLAEFQGLSQELNDNKISRTEYVLKIFQILYKTSKSKIG